MNMEMKIDVGALARGVPEPVAIQARRNLFRSVSAVVVILLLVAAGVYWVLPAKPAEQYVTAPATIGDVTRVVSGSGTVNPVLTIIVGTYVSGVIKSISCDFNTRVRKGQLCATIDPGPYQTAVDQAAASLATAKAQLVKDQSNLAYTQSVDARDVKLLAIGGVSQEAADVARNDYEQAKAQIVYDQASIKQHEAALQAAQVNLDYTKIISPVDGTVVSRNVTVGQTVAASFQTPTLFLIATDLTKMQVDTNVSESDIGTIKPDDKATFTVEAFPERIFHGQVTQVRQAPQTVQNVVTYDVVIAADNRDEVLKPGMTATTRIVTAERQNVLRVADQALRFSPDVAKTASENAGSQSGKGRVWVLDAGRPAPVAVETGLDDDTHTEITGGILKPGDPVIIGTKTGTTAGTAAAGRPRLFGF